ncbi:MAG TPA: Spy/CpxP family protein refolding chaperone [Drouetiella sp.]
MRSSFKTAAVVKRVAIALLIASGALPLHDECLMQSAQADPTRGGVADVLIAQGDASLPAPDSNFHPKSRLGGDFSGVAAQNGAVGDFNSDQLMKRRMRRRMRREGQDAANQNDTPSIGTSGDNSNSGNGATTSVNLGANGPGGGGGGALVGGARRFQAAGGAGDAGGGAFGGGARRFQAAGGGFGGNLFGKKALDLTSLSLSPDQKQKIQDARRQVAPKTKEIRRQLVAKRAELRDMMFQPDMNDDLVRAKRKEVRQLQDKIEDLQLNDFLAIRSVLTPDQRQKLIDLKPGPKVAAGQAQLIAPAVSAQPAP